MVFSIFHSESIFTLSIYQKQQQQNLVESIMHGTSRFCLEGLTVVRWTSSSQQFNAICQNTDGRQDKRRYFKILSI